MRPRLYERYRDEIVSRTLRGVRLSERPSGAALDKIVVNMGVGAATQNPKLVEKATDELASITGQKPIVRKARKSIANFKLRQGQPIGAMVTLRGERMWEFLDRLLTVALPRVRDFKGVSPKAFDGRGNYTLGIREQIIFPEVNYDSVEKITGLNVTVCTTARSDAEGKALLGHLGMPFRQ
jgi:large subunit ribosomal protein L5